MRAAALRRDSPAFGCREFYEGPDDVHTVGRNASKTKPARFLVVLLKQKGVEAVLPADSVFIGILRRQCELLCLQPQFYKVCIGEIR